MDYSPDDASGIYQLLAQVMPGILNNQDPGGAAQNAAPSPQAAAVPLPRPRPPGAPQHPPTPMPQQPPYYASGQGASAYQQQSPMMQEESGQPWSNPGGDSATLDSVIGSANGAQPQQPGGPPWQTLGTPPNPGAPQQPPGPPSNIDMTAMNGGIPPVGGPQQGPAAMSPQAQVPLPPPRPPIPPNAMAQAQPGPPMSLAPPNPGAAPGPPPPMPVKAPPPGQQPGYETAYQPRTGFAGMTPERAARLGAGLSAIGNNWNKPPIAALAGTAGAGIQGGEKAGEQQKEQDVKANAQHFNQMSTAFRDKMLAVQQQNMEGYRQAQAKYLNARADALNRGQGLNGQNSPQKQALDLERQIENERTNSTKLLRDQWKLNGTPEAQQTQQLQQLDQRLETKRQQMYQRIGINPQQGRAIATQGENQKNPIPTQGMTAAQFHSEVPLGAWYQNPDGRILQRNKPPPGQEQKPPSQQSDAGDLYTDMAALNGGQEAPIPPGPAS